ncbi:hypothetical protein SCUP515_11974 [Seiridium cupressi]
MLNFGLYDTLSLPSTLLGLPPLQCRGHFNLKGTAVKEGAVLNRKLSNSTTPAIPSPLFDSIVASPSRFKLRGTNRLARAILEPRSDRPLSPESEKRVAAAAAGGFSSLFSPGTWVWGFSERGSATRKTLAGEHTCGSREGAAMAMQTATKTTAHGKSGSSGSISYTLPASPTLTNPDMILPDYDDPGSPNRSHSPLMMWKNNQFDLNAPAYNISPVTPTTPIIYGNGTMLSDIGEVTEAESTVGHVKSSIATRNGYYQSELARRQVGNAAAQEAMRKKKSEPRMMSKDRERRLSIDSTSTVTNGDNQGVFADFDDSVSVDDSNFQGDDEESVADSYIFDDGQGDGDRTPPASEFARGLGPDAEERYSTALSRRAEQILANAKRRLTTMEGNLNRARSSLSVDSGGSEPSPPFSRPSTAIHRGHDSSVSKHGYGHTRISSENNLPTDFKPATLSPRSSSALGVTGSYRQLLLSSRNVDYKRESPPSDSPKGNSIYGNAAFSKSKTSLHDSKYTLDRLSEDEATQVEVPPRPNLQDAKLDTFLSPTFGSFDDKGLRRSASTAQMRDIKDHMAELKGRLSSLRDQARADSMKRRSMQSLRTASPFTHARESSSDSKTEYPGGKSMKDISRWNDGVESLHESEVGQPHDQALAELDDNATVTSDSVYSDQEALSPRTSLTPAGQPLDEDQPQGSAVDYAGGIIQEGTDDLDDMKTEDGYDDDENTEFEDGMSESGESYYHDSVQNQVSHEDREDAFDYEHFFLHSAMGSMSQKKLRKKGSRESYSSEDSVETTRGPAGNGEYRPSRRGSNASISTLDSFLTATEGRTTRADNEIPEYFPEQLVALPERARSHTPDTAKRMTFDLGMTTSTSDHSQPRASIVQRPQSSAATFTPRPSEHRPSVSSMGSVGTNRSFPLVNKPKSNGILTPRDSPDQGLKKISETLMSETASLCESVNFGEKPIGMLQKEDQILIERLVASLGRCVLGLTENGRASTESRVFRRRIENARQILEGLDQPM